MTFGTPEFWDLVYLYTVKNYIETCLQKFMNQEETMECLWREANISPRVTAIIWRRLQAENVEFFRAYSLWLAVQQQIKTFNMLLSRQAEWMNLPIVTSHQGYHQAPRFYQNLQSVSYDQLTRFSDIASTVPHSAIAFPQDSFPSYPSQPVGAPNNIISAQNSSLMHQNFPASFSSTFSGNGNIENSYPEYRFPDGSLMRQNFPALFSSTFSGNGNIENSYPEYKFPDGSLMRQNFPALFSSTFSGNGSTPQLPMMHDSSMLPPPSNQIVGLGNIPQMHDSSMLPLVKDETVDMPLLPGYTASNIDLHFPKNIKEGTAKQLASGEPWRAEDQRSTIHIGFSHS